jgi:hypothetical protein
MREHCRTQHKYDPSPNVGKQKSPFYSSSKNNETRSRIEETSSSERNRERLSIAVERFMNMITESLKFRELATGHTTPHLKWDLMNSAESAIDYMLDNYVILHKRQIAGVSGYICNNCLTFQFQYIKDIGFDLTAAERHLCIESRVAQANGLQDQDRRSRQNQLYLESIRCLVSLTNSIFTGKKCVIVDSSFRPEYSETNISRTYSSKVGSFHAPVIRMDFITPSHWAWSPIKSGTVGLTNTGLEEIIRNVGGTFAIILIQKGDLSGCHLLYISLFKQD